MTQVEICVGSIEGALAAQAGGAGRVELCAALECGGLTPSAGTIREAERRLQAELVVMLRPRAGDFVYSPAEHDVLLRDLELAGECGAGGVALGVLSPNGEVDAAATGRLVEAAEPMSVTFHRAFDQVPDPVQGLETLLGLGVRRVLTSGQAAGAEHGCGVLSALVLRAAGRAAVVAAGGIRPHNVAAVLAASGVREVHASARAGGGSAEAARVPLGPAGAEALGGSERTRAEAVVALVEAVRRFDAGAR